MKASRTLARSILIALAFTLVACSSTPAPSAVVAVASPSVTASPSSAAATAAPSLAASASPEPSASSEPIATVEPTPEPTVDIDGAAGPGCGTGRLGLLAHNDEVPETLHFGGASIEFTTAGRGLRNGTYYADDAIPSGVGLTRDEIAVRVDPGTHIILRGDGLTLTDVTARVIPWATLIWDAAGSTGPSNQGDDLVWRLRGDGSVSVSAPTAAGDYMAMFFPRWQSTCLKGDGTAYGRIKVNG